MKGINIFSGIQLNWFAVMAGVFCLTVATSASAQQKPSPCADDVARFCKGVPEGEGRIAQCLKSHAKELSQACIESAAEAKEKIQDFVSACKGDMQKFCAGTRPGGGRILQCLKQHETELSADCKKEMKHDKK